MKFFALGFHFLLASAPGQAGDVARLEQIVNEKRITTMEAFLEELPPDLRRNFTLMRKSRSLHGASPEKPRAVLFGDTGKLIVTFNGDHTQSGGNLVEVVEFIDGPKPRFEFREIAFDPAGKKPPSFSGPNPAKCQRCHGEDPKPIWGSYNEDEGVYAPTLEGLKKGSEEEKQFKSFRETAEAHPRYGKLSWVKDNPHFPYIQGEHGKQQLVKDFPNVRLTSLLAANLVKKEAAEVENDPFLFSFLYASVCHFQEEDRPYVKKLDQLLRARGISQKQKTYEKFGRPSNLHQGRFTNELFGVAPSNGFIFYPDTMRKAFGLSHHALSLDLERGPKNKKSETGLLHGTTLMHVKRLIHLVRERDPALKKQYQSQKEILAEGGRLHGISAGLSKEFVDTISESGAFRGDPYDFGRDYCAVLKPLLKKELDALPVDLANCVDEYDGRTEMIPNQNGIADLADKIAAVPRAEFQRVVMDRGCVQCHDPSSAAAVGPAIPFLDEAALRGVAPRLMPELERRISPHADPKVRMPLAGDALSPEERETILFYLKNLAR